MDQSLQLPDDFVAFLGQGQQVVQKPQKCEAGKVRLLPLDKLKLEMFAAQTYGTPFEEADPHRGEPGCYQIPGVSVIAACSGDYDPEGLLVWFPGEQSFGVWDPDHSYVLVFGPEVSWPVIAADISSYVNAQWAFDDLPRANARFIQPFGKYNFE